MPVYLQIILLVVAAGIFFILLLLITGWGIRRICFKIIAEMKEKKAFSAASAVALPEGRRNLFRVGIGNLRPKALNVLIADKLVVKTAAGRYYLNKDKLQDVKK
ncbi:MAG TPA: hypothetical protein PK114_08745 [Smithellaceae bacterium]|nr:hypothetical protein [Smithellaceae bacterium]